MVLHYSINFLFRYFIFASSHSTLIYESFKMTFSFVLNIIYYTYWYFLKTTFGVRRICNLALSCTRRKKNRLMASLKIRTYLIHIKISVTFPLIIGLWYWKNIRYRNKTIFLVFKALVVCYTLRSLNEKSSKIYGARDMLKNENWERASNKISISIKINFLL